MRRHVAVTPYAALWAGAVGSPCSSDPQQPIDEANLQSITTSSHIPKLEPAGFYARA